MKKLFQSTLFLGLIFLLPACGDDDQMVDLPAIIESYISANYPDYEIDESEQETLCTGTEAYEVEIEANDDDELELTFDTEGNFLFAETEIETSELPSGVTATIAADYADYSIDEAERLDLADGAVQYEVELKGSNTLEVLFDAAGAVICEAVDDDE